MLLITRATKKGRRAARAEPAGFEHKGKINLKGQKRTEFYLITFIRQTLHSIQKLRCLHRIFFSHVHKANNTCTFQIITLLTVLFKHGENSLDKRGKSAKLCALLPSRIQEETVDFILQNVPKKISCDKKTRVDAHRATPMHQLRLVNTGKGLETGCLETIKIYTIMIEIFANELLMKITTLFS